MTPTTLEGRPGPRRAPRPGRRLAIVGALLGSALAVGAGGAPARGADDVQPSPPLLFFSQPDKEALDDMQELLETSFADVTKVVGARDTLVRRFGPWAVPPLVALVESGANETVLRNALLTLASIRRRIGPSQLDWPAVRPIVKTLSREGSEPWRRAYAALALGTFYGPDTARRGGGSREGTEAGFRKATEALVEGDAALVRALSDPNGPVACAAAFAIGKIGGMGLASQRAAHRRSSSPPAIPEARVADLIAVGLLPGDEDVTIAAALKDGDRKVRAAAALAVACWAVAEQEARPAKELSGAIAARAHQLEVLLEPSQNVLLRMSEWDGAESVFARGALALLTGRMETWEEIFAIATTTTEARTAVAAAEALLFAPAQSSVRAKMAERAGLENVSHAVQTPVLAAFLLVAGSDGTATGVHACRQFLRNRGREPRGRLEYDVRFHAAVGLVRGLLAGRTAPEVRGEAIDALVEAVRAGLVRGEGRTFRTALEDVVKPLSKAFASDPDARPDPKAVALLEAAFAEPDALLAKDPIDVAVHRLNDALWIVFGLDALPRAVVGGPGGPRTPNREDQELRFLVGWLEREPYFTRLDLLRDRGRIPVPPPLAGREQDREVDR